MEGNIYIGSAITSLVYLALGTRLLWLGIRTRSAVAWLLGLTFLVWALSYAPWVFASSFRDQPALESQSLIAARIATNLGGIGIALFPLLAFRSGSTWAKRLSVSIAIFLVVGTAGSIWVGDPEGVEPLTNVWWWFGWIGEIAPAIWIGAEGFHHYAALAMIWLAFFSPAAYQRKINSSAASA
jgi:hypothetical protein